MSTLEAELEEASKIVELYARIWGERGHAIIEKNSMEFAAALRARAALFRETIAAIEELASKHGDDDVSPSQIILGSLRLLCGPIEDGTSGTEP